MKKPLLRLGVLGAMATAACSDAAAPNGTVESVVVAPASGSLLVGDTTRLVAAAFDADGKPLLNQTIKWATSDPSVATVSGGLVTGQARGTVFIYAASGATADSTILEVVAPFSAVQLSLGDNYACARNSQGAAYCWGSNYDGNLGTGFYAGSLRRPTPVAGGLVWSSVAAGRGHACGLAAGAAYCWGSNYNGEIGDGTTLPRVMPTLVQGIPAISAVVAGSIMSCGIVPAGVQCWGNYSPVLSYSGAPSLQLLNSGDYHVCGLTSNGVAYCWGYNFDGELGDSTANNSDLPAAVWGPTRFTAIDAASAFTCGLAVNGAAFCWGQNFSGQLGDGTSDAKAVPTPVAGGLTFTSIAAGGGHACGLDSQGSVYCWGANYNGELGDGTTISRSSPVAVLGGLRFASLAAGGVHTCGIALSGIVYCWGGNGSGQLGDNTLTDRYEPAVVWAP